MTRISLLRRSAFGWRQYTGIAVILTAVLLSTSLVYRASTAAFTATTENGTNTWQAGSISLSDDDSGSAMFNATGLTPASTGSRCIVVSYTGTVPASVALWGTGSGALAPYLTLKIETGTGGTFATGNPCTGFTPGATIFDGTLQDFIDDHVDHASGAPASSRWTPSSNSSLVYKFTYGVIDDEDAEGASAQANFTWEARGA